MKRKWITRTDAFVLLALLLLALALFLLRPREYGDTVSVYVENELYETLSLSDTPYEYAVSTEKGSLTLAVSPDGVSVIRSDCPDGVCVRTGVIAHKGESIVCVPLGVCITVGKGSLDGVTG